MIQEFKEADVRPVMVTGDNPFTAMNIARACSMLDPATRLLLGRIEQDTGHVKWVEPQGPAGGNFGTLGLVQSN